MAPLRRRLSPALARAVWTLGGVAFVALVAGGLWWLNRPTAGADPDDPVQVALGERVYREHCASCHGADLEGQPDWQVRLPSGRLPAPPHDETGHSWHHPDAVLFDITKRGLGPYAPPGYESDMPAFEGVLTDAEIWAVIAYIKSRWPPEIRARQERMNR